MQTLTEYHAAVVGFDVMLPERDSADLEREQIARQLKLGGGGNAAVQALLAQSNDAKLAAAIRAQGSTYLAYSFSALDEKIKSGDLIGFRTTFLEPRPLFYNFVTKAAGAQDTTIDADAYLPPIPVLNSARAAPPMLISISIPTVRPAPIRPWSASTSAIACRYSRPGRRLCTACATRPAFRRRRYRQSQRRRQPDSSR